MTGWVGHPSVFNPFLQKIVNVSSWLHLTGPPCEGSLWYEIGSVIFGFSQGLSVGDIGGGGGVS